MYIYVLFLYILHIFPSIYNVYIILYIHIFVHSCPPQIYSFHGERARKSVRKFLIIKCDNSVNLFVQRVSTEDGENRVRAYICIHTLEIRY